MSTPKTPFPPSSMSRGSAVFSATGGAISNLVVTGCIKGVTYNSVGRYSVQVAGAPANYTAQITLGDDANLCFPLLTPVANYTPTGFDFAATTITDIYDPALVMVAIP